MPNNTAPVYNPNGMWQVWNYNDIYTGPTGSGQYVPKVGDQVNLINGNVVTTYVVSAVNLGNMLTILSELSPPTGNGDLSNADVLFGVAPRAPGNTYFVYIDKSVTPHVMRIDGRYSVKGSSIVACKVFAGGNVGVGSRVISATYDNSGVYTGENVPLEVVATAAFSSNTSVKAPSDCYTSAELPDGELVTAVFYSNTGAVVTQQQMLVINSGFVARSNARTKFVTGVTLATPFLSSTNSTVINYPLNIPLNVANLTGVVQYSDGTTLSLPIDGVRFSVAGLDSYIATNVGQSYAIVLKYVLQANEYGYGTTNAGVLQMTQSYTLTTSATNLSYQVRLFVYPTWVSTLLGYRLNWYLYDMGRSQSVDVSSVIAVAAGTSAFSPLQYGIRQTLTAQINLKDVSPSYASFIYNQAVDVTLQAPGTFRQNASTPPNWYVTPITGRSPLFGDGSYATFYNVGINNNSVNIAGRYSTLSAWLAAYYTNALPLINTPAESVAPTPTHFTITASGASTTYPITSWNTVITLAQALVSNDTMFIRFILRTNAADLQLAIAAVPLYAVGSNGAYL